MRSAAPPRTSSAFALRVLLHAERQIGLLHSREWMSASENERQALGAAFQQVRQLRWQIRRESKGQRTAGFELRQPGEEG